MTATISTPTIRHGLRRAAFWIGIGLISLLVGLVSLLLAGDGDDGSPRSPDSPGPHGAQAVAEVLQDAGVELSIPSGFAAAGSAVGAGSATTLVVDDPNGFLDPARLASLAESAGTVVLIAPTDEQLDAVAPTVAGAGEVGERVLEARCSFGPAERAGSVDAAGVSYRVTGDPEETERCFASGPGAYSVISVGDVVVIGTTAALTNERVLDRGNAALALGALGQQPRLVWYLPTIDDSGAGAAAATLTPDWVPSIAALAFAVAVAAALWRGRRFGPLVVENLPVLVRPTETMEGRARLYARASARLRALDALRIGTLDRIANHCGLPRLATVDEVIAAASAVSGRDPSAVRRVLLSAEPATDAELVRLSDELIELEHAVTRATRP
ncbi:DUF4350 domain-containing protein [soil metagenome]